MFGLIGIMAAEQGIVVSETPSSVGDTSSRAYHQEQVVDPGEERFRSPISDVEPDQHRQGRAFSLQQRADALRAALTRGLEADKASDVLQFDPEFDCAAALDGSILRLYVFDGIDTWSEAGRALIDGYWQEYFIYSVYRDGDALRVALAMYPHAQMHLSVGDMQADYANGLARWLVPIPLAEVLADTVQTYMQVSPNPDGSFEFKPMQDDCCWPAIRTLPLSETEMAGGYSTMIKIGDDVTGP